MRRLTRPAKTILLICLVFTLVAAGCGKKSNNSNITHSQADAPLPVPTFAPGTTMARVQQAGKLIVGTSYSQPGLSAKDASGNLAGFDIQLVQLIAQRIFGGTEAQAAQKIQWVQAESNNREAFLQNGSIDMAVGAYTITDSLKKVVDFAGPYYLAQGEAVVESSNVRTQAISDLNGQRVCVTVHADYIPHLQIAAPQANLITEPALGQCQTDLTNGTVDAVAGYSWMIAPIAQGSNGTFRLVNSSFYSSPYGIGLKLHDDAFRTFLNNTLQNIETAGDWTNAFDDTLGKLGLPTPKPPTIDNYVSTTTTTGSSTTSTTSSTPSTTTTTTPTSSTSDFVGGQ